MFEFSNFVDGHFGHQFCHSWSELDNRISGGSKRGASGVCPLRPKFFSISCSFIGKFGKIICWHPILEGRCSLFWGYWIRPWEWPKFLKFKYTGSNLQRVRLQWALGYNEHFFVSEMNNSNWHRCLKKSSVTTRTVYNEQVFLWIKNPV